MSNQPLTLPPTIGCAPCRFGSMLYPVNDYYVGRSLAIYGEYSADEARLFAMIIQPGDTVVEVGANIGALTVPLARLVGPEGRVLAFEAQRPIHAILTANLVLNGLDQVWAERVALGAEAGEIAVPTLKLDHVANFGGVSVGGEGDPCPMRTLDSYDLAALRLLKIDVEGAEVAVITGARRTIERHAPILYVENDRRDKSAALIELILGLGYRLWWHTPALYAAENFRGQAENVFGTIVSRNMLGLPPTWTMEIKGLVPITSPSDFPFRG
jgi:FkbM family methyltransferase